MPALATFGGALVLAVLAHPARARRLRGDLARGHWPASATAFGGDADRRSRCSAYPAYLGVKAYRLPMIYDITTDPIDPPRFEAIARLRPRDANPVAYAGLYAAEQQRTAYPDIEPLERRRNAAGRLRRGAAR